MDGYNNRKHKKEQYVHKENFGYYSKSFGLADSLASSFDCGNNDKGKNAWWACNFYAETCGQRGKVVYLP